MSEKVQSTQFKSALITLLSNGIRQVREWLSEQFVPHEVRVGWRALAKTFLKLGSTGFGGGVAVIAQIRRLVVHQQEWMTEEEFLDAVSLAQSLPGANAANAATYVGLKLGGLRGAVASVTGFIFPSFLMMIALTIAHDYLSKFPDAQRIFQGFNAAVVGLIAATVAKLGKTAMQQQWHLELGVAAGFMLIFTATTVAEAVLLAGTIGIFVQFYKTRARQQVRQKFRKERQTSVRTVAAEQQARQHAAELIESPDKLTDDYKVEVTLPTKPGEGEKKEEEKRSPSKAFPKSDPKPEDRAADKDSPGETPPPPFIPIAGKKGVTTKLRGVSPLAVSSLITILPTILLLAWPVLSKLVTVWKLMTIFLRIGTVTFGGGFVMIPQIETDIVDVHRWMDHQIFADGMAFGQITPGPVLITATFIGYKVAGLVGAIVATIAAFLPSFVMTVIAGASLNRFRTNFLVQSFLAGVAPAVVGMLAAAGVALAKSGLGSPLSYGVATLAFLLMLRARLNPVVIIFGCGLLQWAVSRGLISWLHI